MSRRFLAMTNSSGACRLAATVCPLSIARLITMPLTGEVMRVRSRSMRACARLASRWATLAWADATWADATWAWACTALSASVLVLTSARALSASLWAMKPFSTRLCLRSKSRRASSRSTCARDTWVCTASALAWAVITAARDASTSACAERTRYSNVSGSMRASNWPALTSELKSTSSSLIWPLTWVPTVTRATGLTAPLAATVACRFPRSILPVRYSTASAADFWLHHQRPPTATDSMTTDAIR